MKRPLLILFLTFISVGSAVMQAHAFYVDGPGDMNTPSPYPYVLSQPIDYLPEGFTTLKVGNDTFYYSDGTFFQKNMTEQKYLVVPPPIGAVVYSIPQGYKLMTVNDISLYQYQGVFYKRVLEGFMVTYPPA